MAYQQSSPDSQNAYPLPLSPYSSLAGALDINGPSYISVRQNKHLNLGILTVTHSERRDVRIFGSLGTWFD
jgi:hypothetical protein